MIPTLDTYIISDSHWGHHNIIKYCNRPENHDELMFDNWLKTVKTNDIVLHLGDLAFKSNYMNFNALPGEKYLIKGNHDHKSNDWYEDNGFIIMPKRVFFNHEDKKVLFTHYPEKDFWDWDINIHGHIHDRRKRLEYDGRLYINVSVEVMKYTPVQLKYILSGEV